MYELTLINDSLIEQEKEDPYESSVPQREGKKRYYYTSRYERNPINRKKAIEIHGTRCMICGFGFEEFYGEFGRNFIELHHIKPLSEINEEVEINPETDLICVCANCHRMIHRSHDKVLSPDELRHMINNGLNNFFLEAELNMI